jgi:molybdopterin-guanine dinucleotide biosynthesis protein A
MAELAPLYGLVLAGGRSSRMGQDKGSLILEGEPLRVRAARLLAACCEAVYVACRPDQVAGLEPGLHPLCDEMPDLGPLAGLAAAFRHRSDVAWLTVPCDMPGMTVETLLPLIQARRFGLAAVALQRADGAGPESLVSLWEPAMAGLVAAAIAGDERSPRRLLLQAGCQVVPVSDAEVMRNLNAAADWVTWSATSPGNPR